MSVASGDSKPSDGSEKRKYNKSEGSQYAARDNYSRDYPRDSAGYDANRSEAGRDIQERIPNAPMEVLVENNIEKAMKVLKRKLIKEGLFKELKSRKYFEKPSERKKRKMKESVKKVRKDAIRSRKNAMLLS